MILVTTNTSVSVHVNVVEDGGATVRDFGYVSVPSANWLTDK